MKKSLQIVIAIALLSLWSCTPEEVAPDPSEAGSMTCTLNGSPWVAASFNNTLLRITDSEPTGKRLDLRGKGMGKTIILSCGTTSSSVGTSMPQETYMDSNPYEALVTILEGFSLIGSSGGNTATITLTAIDGMTKTCSGTFSFVTSEVGVTDPNYTAVDGVFTDVIYVVM